MKIESIDHNIIKQNKERTKESTTETRTRQFHNNRKCELTMGVAVVNNIDKIPNSLGGEYQKDTPLNSSHFFNFFYIVFQKSYQEVRQHFPCSFVARLQLPSQRKDQLPVLIHHVPGE